MTDIAFKPPFTPHISGLNIGLTVMALLAIAFSWAHLTPQQKVEQTMENKPD